jgi:hypothetical protein
MSPAWSKPLERSFDVVDNVETCRVSKPAVLRVDDYVVLQNLHALVMLDVDHYVKNPSAK